MASPLEELLVVAIEQADAAPLCTAKLADAGARVIKIERQEGDFARGYDDVVQGESSYFVWLNRGKESICLDIKDEADKELVLNMLAVADVFVQNLAPGAAARAGFAPEDLHALNERLIVVNISGYGSEGPYRDMKAYDLLVQCESGLASVTGAENEPGRVGISVCDIACGTSAHAAILEALLERHQTGVGSTIDISLFDSVADWMSVPLFHQEGSGKQPPRVGISHPSIAPYGVYECSDGSRLVIAVQNEREWRSFCEHVLHEPELTTSDIFASNVARCANRALMDNKIAGVFATIDRDAAVQCLQEGGIAFASLNDLQALSDHPQLRRTVVQTPSGEAKLVAPPAQFTDDDLQLGPVPALGEHSDSIRKEFAT